MVLIRMEGRVEALERTVAELRQQTADTNQVCAAILGQIRAFEARFLVIEGQIDQLRQKRTSERRSQHEEIHNKEDGEDITEVQKMYVEDEDGLNIQEPAKEKSNLVGKGISHSRIDIVDRISSFKPLFGNRLPLKPSNFCSGVQIDNQESRILRLSPNTPPPPLEPPHSYAITRELQRHSCLKLNATIAQFSLIDKSTVAEFCIPSFTAINPYVECEGILNAQLVFVKHPQWGIVLKTACDSLVDFGLLYSGSCNSIDNRENSIWDPGGGYYWQEMVLGWLLMRIEAKYDHIIFALEVFVGWLLMRIEAKWFFIVSTTSLLLLLFLSPLVETSLASPLPPCLTEEPIMNTKPAELLDIRYDKKMAMLKF